MQVVSDTIATDGEDDILSVVFALEDVWFGFATACRVLSVVMLPIIAQDKCCETECFGYDSDFPMFID